MLIMYNSSRRDWVCVMAVSIVFTWKLQAVTSQLAVAPAVPFTTAGLAIRNVSQLLNRLAFEANGIWRFSILSEVLEKY